MIEHYCLQDQIIIFLALAKGHSTIKAGPITDHTRQVMFLTRANKF